jgi:hypothetical protein
MMGTRLEFRQNLNLSDSGDGGCRVRKEPRYDVLARRLTVRGRGMSRSAYRIEGFIPGHHVGQKYVRGLVQSLEGLEGLSTGNL